MAMHARAWARLQRDAKQEDAGNGSQRLKRQQRRHDHPLPQHQQQHARQQQDRPVAPLEACEAGTCSTSAPGKTPLNHVLSTWSCCASRQRTQLTDKISSMEHLGRALRPPGARPAAWRRTRQRSQRRTRAWPGTGARAAPSAAAAPGHRLGGRRAGAASLRRAMARHVIGSRAGGAIT